MKNVIAIIQARMTSQRLPGKVLTRVGGKPVLQWVVERLKPCQGLESIVIATSHTPEDNPIAEFCAQQGLRCHRGSLHNVAERFYAVAQESKAKAFLRISADSPLVDPRLVDQAISLYEKQEPDLVTNVHPRTYPSGQSVEIVDRQTYLRTFPKIREADDQEHVTAYFYKHAPDFSIVPFKAPHAYPKIHLAIDTAEDLTLFTRLAGAMEKDHTRYGLDEIIALHTQLMQKPGKSA